MTAAGLTITILGCGSSGGVPRPGLGWGACDPNNPKNRRRRCSILVEREGPDGKTSVLVDTSPDLREQLLGADVTRLDAVFYTHDHADHTHGIDDLRPLVIYNRRRIPVFMTSETSRALHHRFSYCFTSSTTYPPILDENRLTPGTPVTVTGDGGAITGLPVEVVHGDISALGFRFGDAAYSCDLNDMSEEAASALQGLDLWIVDALRYDPHPSHFSLADALGWIERLKPKQAILTNMHVDLDYDVLRASLPANVEPAFDGMRVKV